MRHRLLPVSGGGRKATADENPGLNGAAAAVQIVSAMAAPPEKYPTTPQGAQKLRDELHRLKEERPKISREIGIARDHGDLSENAEYHAAKDRQGMIEARIKDIEDKLSRAEVIDPSTLSGDRVRFGANVALANLDTDEEVTYRLVGADEADIDQGSISVSSPLARALIGKEVGDEVTVVLPAGKRRYEIVRVEFR
jgi:transcription elongation factor GreA